MTTWSVSDADIAAIEADPELWLYTLFPSYMSFGADEAGEPALVPFAPHHREYLRWLWAIKRDLSPDPRADIEIWARGGAKSTLAELGNVAVAARRTRRYGIYVCDTQDQANDHVGNVGGMLQTARFAAFYPEASSRRRLGMYGKQGAWRRNRLQVPGFTLDAIGLDTAARGIKLDEDRPDLLTFDDIDKDTDSAVVTSKKRRLLSRTLIPATSGNAAYLGIQNLVNRAGIFASLARGTADLLLSRRVGGPVPALRNFNPAKHLERQLDGTYRIVPDEQGRLPEPTWVGQSIEKCEQQINDMGVDAFMSEMQHDLAAQDDRVFPSFDEKLHRYPYTRLPVFKELVGGLDFGGEGLTAHFSSGSLIGLTPSNRRILVAVFKQRGPNVTDRQIRWMLEMQARWRPDGELIRWAGDRTQSAAIAMMRTAGFRIRRSRAGGEDAAGRETRIRGLGGVLALEAVTRTKNVRLEGPQQALPGFYYLRELVDFEDEMLSYKRESPPAPDIPSQRRPIRVNDDVIDSVLYAEELIERILAGYADEDEVATATVRR